MREIQTLHEITFVGFSCERCKHDWIPRQGKSHPIVCPKCKSPYWNKPRQQSEEIEK